MDIAHLLSSGRKWLAAGILPLVMLTAGGAEAAEADQKARRPQLFGTVEFRMSLEKQKNWLSVLRRNAESPVFFDENTLSRSTTWKQLRSRIEGKDLGEKLAEVNRFWNSWPYRTDAEVWSQEDYWASPAEFIRRSGDCEDYCIAKYFTLRELGIPAEDMRIVIVKETIRGLAHAVLAVYDGQQVYILDNLIDNVRPMRRVRNYQPHFSVNEKARWMHVKAKPVKRAATPMENGHGTK